MTADYPPPPPPPAPAPTPAATSQRNRWILAAVVVAVLVLVAVVAYVAWPAKHGKVNADDLEQDIRTKLAAQADVDASDIAVDCPTGVEIHAGRVFHCILTDNSVSTPATYEVTVTIESDDGSMTWKLENS